MKKFVKHKSFYVYILKCKDKTYYTGYTQDIKKRVELHNKGKGAKYTRDRGPVKLVWKKEYKYFKKAFLEEKRIKTLRREQKKELIKNGAKP
ncbi:MAG: GIY-YIG nuclease family protein [Candidatus Omnitrophica bacterium]|nr:GIY-YIG nuclease family protein [Candidatus Omnitrophota bacterium]